MKITFDPVKRGKTLVERRLDFADAPKVFGGRDQFTYKDERKNYGEDRFITVGILDKNVVVMVWTPREEARHIISLRKANDREKKKFKIYLD